MYIATVYDKTDIKYKTHVRRKTMLTEYHNENL